MLRLAMGTAVEDALFEETRRKSADLCRVGKAVTEASDQSRRLNSIFVIKAEHARQQAAAAPPPNHFYPTTAEIQ